MRRGVRAQEVKVAGVVVVVIVIAVAPTLERTKEGAQCTAYKVHGCHSDRLRGPPISTH